MLPVYSRADLRRTAAVVVALFLTAAATGAVARQSRAPDTQNEHYQTAQALRCMGRPIADAAAAQLIERIRKVE